jgi:PEP-CTERM motif
MTFVKKLFTFVLFAFAVDRAFADPIVLTFDGILSSYPTPMYSSNPYVEDFYNGGTSSAGTTGTDYGITFSSNAIGFCLNPFGFQCSNSSRGGLGNPNSQEGALGGISDMSLGHIYINDPAGFINQISFVYASPNVSGAVNVYSGPNGTGTLLATQNLNTTPSTCALGYGAKFCPFFPVSLSFSGTAESIDFAGYPVQMAIDDVILESATLIGTTGPPSVPEPSTLAMFSTGSLVLAGLARRRFHRQ